MYGAGFRAASQHSQCLYPIFTHIPGLKVALPSNAYEAKGLLIQAIRDDDPVIFFEHKAMYDEEAEVPDEAYAIPFGEANVTREGDDVTIVAFGRMVNFANEVADKLGKEGIRCTVVDPRTTSPLDTETILETVEETGRVVVVDEAHPRCNMAADIAALVAANALRQAEGADPDGDRAACAGAVLAGAGGSLHPEPGQDRGRRPRGRGEGSLMAAIQTDRHAQMGPGDAGGHARRLARRRGRRSPKGQEIMDIETSKIANVFESPVTGRAAAAGWSARARRCRSARCSASSPRRGDADAAIDAFVAEFQASFAASRPRRRRARPSPSRSRSAAAGSAISARRRGRARRSCSCTASAAT